MRRWPGRSDAGTRDCRADQHADRRVAEAGVPIFWVLHANAQTASASDWELFFTYVVASEVRARTLQSLAPGISGYGLDSSPIRRHSDYKEQVQCIDSRVVSAGACSTEPRPRYRTDRRHQNQRLLRVDRPRCDDARFQNGDGVRLLCSINPTMNIGVHLKTLSSNLETS